MTDTNDALSRTDDKADDAILFISDCYRTLDDAAPGYVCVRVCESAFCGPDIVLSYVRALFERSTR